MRKVAPIKKCKKYFTLTPTATVTDPPPSHQDATADLDLVTRYKKTIFDNFKAKIADSETLHTFT